MEPTLLPCGLGRRGFGTLLTVTGVLVLCPDSLLLRLLDRVDNYTVLFYRGLLFAIAELIYIFLLQLDPRTTLRQLASLGGFGLMAGCVQGASQVLIAIAIFNAPAANALVINATNPVFSAAFSYLLLGEVIERKTIAVIVVAIGAILLVVSSDFGKDSGGSNELLGNMCALGASATIGLFFVMCRMDAEKSPGSNFLFCNVVSGTFMAVCAVCIGNGVGPILSPDLGLLCAMGLGVLPISFTLLTIGPDYITAPEVIQVSRYKARNGVK